MKLTDIILKEFNHDLSLPGQSLPVVKRVLERVCGPGEFSSMGGDEYFFIPDSPEKVPDSFTENVRKNLERAGWKAFPEKGNSVYLQHLVDWSPVDTSGKIVVHVTSDRFEPEYFLKNGLRAKDDGSRNQKAIYGVLLPKNYEKKDLSAALWDLEHWMGNFEKRSVVSVDLSKYRLPWYLDKMDRMYGDFPAVLTVSNIPGNCLHYMGNAYKLTYEANES